MVISSENLPPLFCRNCQLSTGKSLKCVWAAQILKNIDGDPPNTYQEKMKVECVVCLSCFICAAICSAVILAVFLPLQFCETVENDTVSLCGFMEIKLSITQKGQSIHGICWYVYKLE